MIEDIRYSKKFKKQYKKLPFKIQQRTKERIRLLYEDPFNPILKHHILSGNLRGVHSINITADYRALYIEINNKKIMFDMIGAHSQLYK
ncbi:MAG: type II toxin-antitoxin system mRNA interferase toxin, RelE/StbE family [Candidatus Saccharibacteria bacterium]|nr:type II toxin-antitoxin system mRNA interferase toxin, RelE/StbE family [Candidatus Saccharibacteria bacterium]